MNKYNELRKENQAKTNYYHSVGATSFQKETPIVDEDTMATLSPSKETEIILDRLTVLEKLLEETVNISSRTVYRLYGSTLGPVPTTGNNNTKAPHEPSNLERIQEAITRITILTELARDLSYKLDTL